MNQTTLPFHFAPSYRHEDYLVSSANEMAYGWIMRWPDWPSPILNLHGPAGSGKTHLAHIWAEKAQAGWLTEDDIAASPAHDAIRSHDAWVMEAPDMPAHETRWFHLINTLREEGKYMLITSSMPLSKTAVTLPDLRSRITALPAVALQDPDDTLLTALLTKRFADLQLKVDPEVIQYLVNRMERSCMSVHKIVQRLDTHSLVEKRNITMPLARKILETQ